MPKHTCCFHTIEERQTTINAARQAQGNKSWLVLLAVELHRLQSNFGVFWVEFGS